MFGGFYGADHLTFEGVMGDFRKKISYRLIQGGKACKDIAGKIISCTEKNIVHDVYNAEKKSYTAICQGKNF